MKKESKIKKAEIEHIKCVWGLICSLSSTDIEKNNISLFNVIEQFSVPSEFFIKQSDENKSSLIHGPHEIILWWRRTLPLEIFDEEILIDFKIKTIDPAGKIIQETVSALKFPKGIKSLRFRIIMPVLVFTTTGDYIHQVEVKLPNSIEFNKKLEIPFEVRAV